MHGLFLLEFKQYVMDSMGTDTWNTIAQETGLQDQLFLPDQVYPDEHFQVLLLSTSERRGPGALHETQEAFGRHIAPRLLRMYRTQINPSWDALDVIENAETAIHRAVRLREPNADPPRLRSIRTSPGEVVIHYDSPRRLCGVAIGIADGVSTHYHEELEIEEQGCTVRGDRSSQIHIRRTPVSSGRSRSVSRHEPQTSPLEGSGP